MIKTIAIVGRPNVGKSTLFNTLINRREALTSASPGLTRDRSYAHFKPDGTHQYLLIDTGGLVIGSDKPVDEKVNMQAEIAVSQADLVLFLVDSRDGVTPMDENVAQMLRKSSKKVLIAANKSDNPKDDIMMNDFFVLGFEDIVAISAVHKRNIYELVSRIIEFLPESYQKEKKKDHLTLCIAGRPNVGKSTLVNRLLGEKRVIVDEKPGTTRNPAKCYLEIGGREWELVDLAGMWRRKRGKEVEEIISMLASRREIEQADVTVLLLDLSRPLSVQDKRIAGWITDAGSSVIVAGNKVDLIEKEKNMEEIYRKGMLQVIPFLEFAPFIIVSAKEGTGIERLYEELEKVTVSAFEKIPQEKLEIFLNKLVSKRPPPEAANRRPEVIRIYQSSVNPPVFTLKIHHHRLDKIPEHWKNYVRNSIYKEFGYYGAPVKVKFKKTGKVNK